MTSHTHPSDGALGELGERGLLDSVFHALGALPEAGMRLGPGDDAALLAVPSRAVLVTTDAMVRGMDWLDEWSTGQDVGIKAVTQNLADIAAMGGVGTGLLVTLIVDPDLPARWAHALTQGLVEGAERAGVPVIGGDLSSAPSGVVALSVTALGELGEPLTEPVTRAGARPGQVLGVSGPLGRSACGLALLGAGGEGTVHETGDPDLAMELITFHRRPLTDLAQGPIAARAGASSMIDVSDGLIRDGDRVARASGVRIDLDEQAVNDLAEHLTPAMGSHTARQAVLTGGEEHELLATFRDSGAIPEGWIALGTVTEVALGDEPGVWWLGERQDPAEGGWDHFGG